MITNQILKSILLEKKDITGFDFWLFNPSGQKIVETKGLENEDLLKAVNQFIESKLLKLTLESYSFIKIFIRNNLEYVLAINSKEENSEMILKLVYSEIKNIFDLTNKNLSKTDFFRNIFLGNIIQSDIRELAKSSHIEYTSNRLIFVIEVKEKSIEIVKETLINLVTLNKDFVTEVSSTLIALIKEDEGLNVKEFGESIVDTLESEAMTKVSMGVSSQIEDLKEVNNAFKEAVLALKVGKLFYESSEVFQYTKLGVGRLINQLPLDLCEIFLNEIFGKKIPNLNDEENTNIVQVLFKNNLNISEAARQLFMHRNTLVYRLDKIEKQTGLDVRKFDDAILYSIGKMVLKHVNNIKMK